MIGAPKVVSRYRQGGVLRRFAISWTEDEREKEIIGWTPSMPFCSWERTAWQRSSFSFVSASLKKICFRTRPPPNEILRDQSVAMLWDFTSSCMSKGDIELELLAMKLMTRATLRIVFQHLSLACALSRSRVKSSSGRASLVDTAQNVTTAPTE